MFELCAGVHVSKKCVIDTFYLKTCAKFSPDYLDSTTNSEYTTYVSSNEIIFMGFFIIIFIYLEYTLENIKMEYLNFAIQ